MGRYRQVWMLCVAALLLVAASLPEHKFAIGLALSLIFLGRL